MRFYILFLLFVTTAARAQNSQETNYKLNYPDNISSNSAFDISLVAANPYSDAARLVLYFNVSSKVNFKSLELRTLNNFSVIPCRQIELENSSNNVYKAEIDLKKNKIGSSNYFQLLFNLKADNALNADFQFSGIFKSDGRTLGYIQSPDNYDEEDTLRFSSVQLKFYKPQKFAGSSIIVDPGGEFILSPDFSDINNLLTEFWIRINDKQINFLHIVNRQTNETLCELSTNPFQMVTSRVPSQLNQELKNPYFISRGNWYHFSILSAFDEDMLNIFCGNTLICTFKLPSFLKTGDLEWEFLNESQNKTFQIDLLRFIDFNNDIGISYINENYLNFIDQKSGVLYQFSFESEDELYAANNGMNVKFNSVNFQKSDAPIFARAPELNVNLLGSAYELMWSGGDYKQAETYFLEKSVDNSDFKTVSSVQADNSYDKKYSLLDARDPSAGVVYYRIKQVNLDGSVVYSSGVKIGQGVTEPFVVEQNYPNPFNPRTSIVVDLMEDTDVEITVYNLEGKEITKLFKGFLTQGTHKFSFDASELSSGIYLYKVSTPEYSDTKKMILTK